MDTISNVHISKDTFTASFHGKVDSGNAPEVERVLLDALADAGAEGSALTADFNLSELSYISSAGLRVLLKLGKMVSSLTLSGVSREVAEILEVTGFSSIFKVEKAIRQIDISGLKCIGTGATGKVYRLDDERIVKLFNATIRLEAVINEQDIARRAFVLGVPTCIPFEVVQSNGQYGIIYELIDSDNVREYIMNNGVNDDLVDKYVRLMKSAHAVVFQKGQGEVSFSRKLAGAIGRIVGDVFSQADVENLKALILAVPDADRFVHGDCHPGNVMIHEGECVFIDMLTSSPDHPFWDIVGLCTVCHTSYLTNTKERYLALHKVDPEVNAEFWDKCLRKYYNTEDADLLRRVQTYADSLGAIRSILGHYLLGHSKEKESIIRLRKTALAAVGMPTDGIFDIL